MQHHWHIACGNLKGRLTASKATTDHMHGFVERVAHLSHDKLLIPKDARQIFTRVRTRRRRHRLRRSLGNDLAPAITTFRP